MLRLSKNIAIILIFCLINAINAFSQIINEFMPAPLGNCPEWIEIYNHSSQQINDVYYIKDAGKSKAKVTLAIKANGYAVISKDTTLLKKYVHFPDSSSLIQAKFPALNNTQDYIYLYNSGEAIIDSLYYSITKEHYGKSIERKSPMISFDNSNFAICVARDSSTCGYLNSVSIFNTLPVINSEPIITISQNPFDKAIGDECILQIATDIESSHCSIIICDLNGSRLADIENITTIGRDYRKNIAEQIRNLEIGAYVINISLSDKKSGKNHSQQILIAVGDSSK